ncbi:hypothetical protein [Lachnospira pectinoschiza]|uniref:Uncharacterized protein n=1 Tax=Lachnospira pectinoschiza TaxID=28052 RepID=A0A1G9V5Z1_9FIRM|nr:hypothetical protein [Lachnospira pectinoschiza]SDM67601.1 hypothetical protein SAMN05216544_0825 [Lachnospira pectinoschiza]
MPNNDEDYLNKLLQSVGADENLAKGKKASKANLSADELEEERLSREVRNAVDRNNASNKDESIEAFNEEDANSIDSINPEDFADLEGLAEDDELENELNDDFDDADLSEDDESASLIDALGDIMDGYNDSGLDLNLEDEANAVTDDDDNDEDNNDEDELTIDPDDLEKDSEVEEESEEESDEELDEELEGSDEELDADDNDHEDEISIEESGDADGDEAADDEADDEAGGDGDETADDEADGDDADLSSLEDIMAETEEIDEEEAIDPEAVKDNVSEDDGLSEEEKDLKADEEIDKLLSETDLDEGMDLASNDLAGEFADGELSDNEIERLVNMDLDNIIEDATSDSMSVEELFAEDDEETREDGDEAEDKKKEKKEKKKKEKKAKKSKDEVELDDLIEETTKKPGFLAKLKDIFFESLEDEDLEEEDETRGKSKRRTDENGRILDEIDGEAGEDGAPKKGFFAKFKYRLAQWKKKQAEEEAQEEEQQAIADEEAKKAKEEKKAAAKEAKEAKKAAEKEKPKKEKKEKPKKEPKPKKPKKPKPEPKPEDILKIKPVSMIMFILFVAGVIVLLLVLINAVNYDYSSSTAKNYFNKGDYAAAYEALDGLSLNESDTTLYEQAKTILYVERQYEAYTLYLQMNDNTEALNSLIKGVIAYDKYCDAAEALGVSDEFEAAYEEILNALEDTFSIGENKAESLAEMYSSDFTEYYFVIIEYGKAAGTE